MLFLLEMAWAMSKEESNRKAVKEQAVSPSEHSSHPVTQMTAAASCAGPGVSKGILATAQVTIFLKHSNLLEVQTAFQNGNLPSLRQTICWDLLVFFGFPRTRQFQSWDKKEIKL